MAMNEQRRFGDTDHEPLQPDDILAQAIGQWRDELPQRDLWAGVADRLEPRSVSTATVTRTFTFTMSQLAIAASFLIAVVAGVTWLAVNRAAVSGGAANGGEVIQAYTTGAPEGAGGQIVPANFADAQFNAAVTDLERILRSERDRLDPRTVLIIERNLKAIDDAINEARMALDNDPANPYLNSHLADARRRKLDLLRRATALASVSGD